MRPTALPMSGVELQRLAHAITTGSIPDVPLAVVRDLLATIALRDRTIEKARQAFRKLKSVASGFSPSNEVEK